MTSNQKRVIKGVSAGGQFATDRRSESDVELVAAEVPQFGDVVVKGRGATTSAAVASIGDVEIRATVRVSHAERGFYAGSVVRGVHDARTGETVMAPHVLVAMSTGDSTSGRFSEKGLVAATEELRDRLIGEYAEGKPLAARVLTPELSDKDREYAAGLVEQRRPRV